MYSLNLAEDNRILSVCECLEGIEYDNVVDSFPEDDITDYKYINGEYVHDPKPKPEPEPEKPTKLDALEAQVTYTAMMTDTLLETEV